jgi:hypothetical protein
MILEATSVDNRPRWKLCCKSRNRRRIFTGREPGVLATGISEIVIVEEVDRPNPPADPSRRFGQESSASTDHQ